MIPQKCGHIPDAAILEFLAKHQGKWSTHGNQHFLMNGQKGMPTVQDAMPLAVFKLQLAKMRKLWKRGLIGGCPCGCRGDWEITDKGLALIDQPRTAPYSGY